MPADPFTPAELDAACDATRAAGPHAFPVDYARAVLSAVAPLIAARVRAEVAEQIAADLEQQPAVAGPHAAAAIARAHRTTPEPADDH